MEEPVLPPPYETRDSINFKLSLLEMYNHRLEKRADAKAVMFDRGLLDYKKVCFASFHTGWRGLTAFARCK